MSNETRIKTFFDKRTFTLTYVLYSSGSRQALVIDPVLDYEPGASRIFTESLDEVIAFIRQEGLDLRYILETHAHADHLSGSQLLRAAFPGSMVAIGARITEVQAKFKQVFNLPDDFPTDGSQFDRLLSHGEVLEVGPMSVEVFNTPGHTPACVTYKVGDWIFTGDALFMPDSGTGRCDFPGGSAQEMYRGITRHLYNLPDETRVFVGHDYQPGGRELAYESTIGEQKAHNVALPATRDEADFVAWREQRDATLSAPKLLFQSVQVNVDGGHMPSPADNGVRYLRIPINVFRPEGTVDDPTLEKV